MRMPYHWALITIFNKNTVRKKGGFCRPFYLVPKLLGKRKFIVIYLGNFRKKNISKSVMNRMNICRIEK